MYAKIDTDALKAFLAENQDKNLTDAQFAERYLKGVVETLNAKPKMYRSFGAYWWPIKKLMLEKNLLPMGFGDSYDATMAEQFTYESESLTVCAAYLYQQDAIESGLVFSNTHPLDLEGSLESEIYTLEDSDVERLILAGSFK